jgi:hypothetical protein
MRKKLSRLSWWSRREDTRDGHFARIVCSKCPEVAPLQQIDEHNCRHTREPRRLVTRDPGKPDRRRDQSRDFRQRTAATSLTVAAQAGNPKLKIEPSLSFRSLPACAVGSRAQAQPRASVGLGGVVEIDAGMLRADIDVAKCRLQRARRVHRVRARSREHSRDGAAA